jgi:hypothetical protein
VTLAEPRDRRVVRDLTRGQDAKRDVVLTGALDRPRRPDPARVSIDQQRDHHRRIKRRPAVPVLPIVNRPGQTSLCATATMESWAATTAAAAPERTIDRS